MIDRVGIKTRAKEVFKANYWPCVGWFLLATIIVSACTGLVSLIIGIAGVIIVVPVVSIGQSLYAYRTYMGMSVDGSGELFGGFSNLGHFLGGYWWMQLFLFLWALIPVAGIVMVIIKGLAYSMTPYILADQPEIGAQDALKLSIKMTEGHKGELFVMSLSFIGWNLLSALTAGILAIFYVVPYESVSMAGCYAVLKQAYRE